MPEATEEAGDTLGDQRLLGNVPSVPCKVLSLRATLTLFGRLYNISRLYIIPFLDVKPKFTPLVSAPMGDYVGKPMS